MFVVRQTSCSCLVYSSNFGEKKYAKQWAKMDLKWSKIHKNPFVGRAPVHPDPVKSFSTYLDSLAGFLGDE